MRHIRYHRITFILAGCYNLMWGIGTALFPMAFFQFTGMDRPNHPEFVACLGMVISLYGLLYWEVARRPQIQWPIVVVGMMGKIFGPIGTTQLLVQGAWPLKALWLCVFNDVIWWIPFGWYLWDVYQSRPMNGNY